VITEARLNEILAEQGVALAQAFGQILAKHTANVSRALTNEEGDHPSE